MLIYHEVYLVLLTPLSYLWSSVPNNQKQDGWGSIYIVIFMIYHFNNLLKSAE